MHECNAHICCLYFITSNPGVLQFYQRAKFQTQISFLKMQLKNAVFEFFLKRATCTSSYIYSFRGYNYYIFLFFLKLRDISGVHAHQIYTPYTDFLCNQIYTPYISGARNRILILSFPSDQTIIVGSFLSKLCDHGPIKQRMHVLPVYMICFLKLLPHITHD
jgi:hypothetical protein